MSIRRYKPEADTTITNAYKGNLTTRATGSNMGESDVLEVFNVYAQASSTSSEQSRILIKFPITGISADRATEIIPASGRVNFYLRLYNVPHGETLPTNFSLEVGSITKAWDEGHGLDMEEYSDMGVTGTGNTFGGTGASWTVASSGVNWDTAGGDFSTSISSSIKLLLHGDSTIIADSSVNDTPCVANGDAQIDTDSIVNSGRTGFGSSSIKFDGTGDYISATGAVSDLTSSGDFTCDFWVRFSAISSSQMGLFATGIYDDLHLELQANNTLRASIRTRDSDFNNTVLKNVDSTKNDFVIDTWYHVAIIREETEFKIWVNGALEGTTTGVDDGLINDRATDFHIGRYDATYLNGYIDEFRFTNYALWTGISNFSIPSESFKPVTTLLTEGTEDVLVDITSTVEDWISSSVANHGIVIKLPDSIESGTESFYTKKFSARDSEYFFKRPVIEARWDSSERDDRNNFYAKSNLRSDNDNVFSIKNYVNGVLTNIPGVGLTDMTVKFQTPEQVALSSVAATASMTVTSGIFGDSDYISLTDSADTTKIFEFQAGSNLLISDAVTVCLQATAYAPCIGAPTANTAPLQLTALAGAINATTELKITATASGSVINLVQDIKGADGNNNSPVLTPWSTSTVEVDTVTFSGGVSNDTTPDSLVVDNTTTGIYKATVVLSTTSSEVTAEWQDAATTVLHTETIYIKQRSVAAANIPEYVTTIQNFKKVYSNDEMARFRLFIRSKDWSPTIYTVATTELKSEVVADAYYKIMRVVDDFTVIDYGSGTIPHTKLSYDENGPYFDFDMSMLETGWAYRIEFMYKINGEMKQQPEAFKFRVVE